MLNREKYNELMNSYDSVLIYYVLQMVRLAEDDGLLVNLRDEYITSYAELWELIDCKDGKSRAKVKEFTFFNGLVKQIKLDNHKAFKLNEKYFKIF